MTDLKKLSLGRLYEMIIQADLLRERRKWENIDVKKMSKEEAEKDAYEWAVENHNLKNLQDEEERRALVDAGELEEDENLPPCGNASCDTNCTYCFPQEGYDAAGEI